jgi:hypothetical protein
MRAIRSVVLLLGLFAGGCHHAPAVGQVVQPGVSGGAGQAPAASCPPGAPSVECGAGGEGDRALTLGVLLVTAVVAVGVLDELLR